MKTEVDGKVLSRSPHSANVFSLRVLLLIRLLKQCCSKSVQCYGLPLSQNPVGMLHVQVKARNLSVK